MDKKWDEKKYPPHMRMDAKKRNDNIAAGRKLCERCEGTGNQFYSMYSKCFACNGKGFVEGKNGKE